jgi:hypothetical protein
MTASTNPQSDQRTQLGGYELRAQLSRTRFSSVWLAVPSPRAWAHDPAPQQQPREAAQPGPTAAEEGAACDADGCASGSHQDGDAVVVKVCEAPPAAGTPPPHFNSLCI